MIIAKTHGQVIIATAGPIVARLAQQLSKDARLTACESRVQQLDLLTGAGEARDSLHGGIKVVQRTNSQHAARVAGYNSLLERLLIPHAQCPQYLPTPAVDIQVFPGKAG